MLGRGVGEAGGEWDTQEYRDRDVGVRGRHSSAVAL